MEIADKMRAQLDIKEHVERDRFVSRIGVFLATVGSAVGLGNIWKFPALTGSNGGGAFLLVYVASTLLIGLPVMISEHMIGRTYRANAVRSMRQATTGRTPWWLVGAAGVLSAFLILAFYTEVAGWVFTNVLKAFSGGLLSTDPAVTSQAFGSMVTDPVMSLAAQWVVFAVITAIIMMGVSKGIERATKRLLPVLFFLLVVVCIRGLTLPGAAAGLRFLFKPDLDALTWAAVLTAMGLAFFKLSVGMGTMITYGSYFPEDQNIPATAVRVMLSDLFISMLAGVAIFPTVFTYGFAPDAGPSLLFITMPAVFASMPFGQVFMVIFFFLTAIASIGAMISILEVPVALLQEERHYTRAKATLIIMGLLFVAGATAALSSSVLADVTVFGKSFFDLYDFTSSNVLLPLGGLFISIFVGWVWGKENTVAALTNDGALANGKLVSVFFFITRYISPVLIAVILLQGLGLF